MSTHVLYLNSVLSARTKVAKTAASAASLATGPAIDPNQRMEDFTIAKEAQMKKRGAEIITVDAYQDSPDQQQQQQGAAATAAAADDGDDDGMYTPKVATWGIFPRPKNISKAYGGGRNIRPGQALETDDQKKKREVGGWVGGWSE